MKHCLLLYGIPGSSITGGGGVSHDGQVGQGSHIGQIGHVGHVGQGSAVRHVGQVGQDSATVVVK